MKIEHLAMYVNDLEKSRNFFETYFGAAASNLYHNQTTGFRSYFLSFDGGARLEIMNLPTISAGEPMARTGFAHAAFSVGSKEKVNQLTETLRAHGFPVISGPRITGDVYYESCVLDGEGNPIEITV